MPRIRVLIVDDSVLIRRRLAESLAQDPDLEVVGKAASGPLGIAKIVQLSPDIVVLDADMPEMDGLATLHQIRHTHPRLPVVMLTAAADDGATRAREAAASGAAVHVVEPRTSDGTALRLERLDDELVRTIKELCARATAPTVPPSRAAAHSAVVPAWTARPHPIPSGGVAVRLPRLLARPAGRSTAPHVPCAQPIVAPLAAGSVESVRMPHRSRSGRPPSSQRITPPPAPPHIATSRPLLGVLAIASSTGGPAALAAVLSELPASFPLPVVIAQHMPPMFTRLLAERLSMRCPLAVHEAAGGEILRPGTAWIAPGDHHMVLEQGPAGLELRLNQEPPENSCRPSADVLLRSVATACGENTIALVLTGMGHDGLNGCRWIKERHGRVLAQDQETSVVWGMPGYVARAGIADRVLPLQHVASELLRMTNRDTGARVAHMAGVRP